MLLPLVLALSTLRRVAATQIPLLSPVAQDDSSDWQNLSARPDPNATGHLIFDTVNSFLQHWPNTRYRNGHNIVPATVPINTLLYHGRADDQLPTVPEWTSTDPEHAFPFCDDNAPTNDSTVAGCWQLTLVTMRPLTVLYFDGSSAANIREGGPMDVQDLLVWGTVDPKRWVDERARIDDLCAWGKEFGIDGYLRMEMDFEIMLCDFHNPSRPNAHSSLLAQNPTPPTDDGLPIADIMRFSTVEAGSWHNRYPGDTRVRLDLARMVSFYDPALAPSLAAAREGVERWEHRVHAISEVDLGAVKARLREVLSSPADGRGSGVDWQTLYHVIVDRYADRLEMVGYLLTTTTPAKMADRARIIQTQLRIMLTPYILYSARPSPSASTHPEVEVRGAGDDAWAAPVWHACATRHTAHIHHALRPRLAPGEHTLLRALDETTREVCRVLTRMWAAGVNAGLDPLIPVASTTPTSPNHTAAMEMESVVERWHAEIVALTGWLDWGVWVKCRPACGCEEMCYLPTWPWFYDRSNPTDDAWKRPTPRCVRRFEPYSPLVA
ncbi:hypothetical protein C8R46DRAFT_1175711 [Mycena filopes]|nr:hypothetical protein C8R46DRAFT_1175711 [Mycena filopes]